MLFTKIQLVLLSVAGPTALAMPLLGPIVAPLAGLTGTHLTGSTGKVGEVLSKVTGSLIAARDASAGLLGGVTGALDSVAGRATGGVVGGVVGGLGGTVSSVLGSVPALLQANCDAKGLKCTVTVSGEIENMLTDGSNFTGKTTISAWMKDGHAYGSAQLAGAAPLPFTITCDAKADVCLGSVTGNLTQVFTNGKQVALWGWTTPSGSCRNGTCSGSLTACGDPGYRKAKRADLC